MSSFSQRPTRKKIKSPDYTVGCCKLYKPKKPKDFCSWAIVKKKTNRGDKYCDRSLLKMYFD